MPLRPKPFLLLILDGFGLAPASPFNAITLAQTPHLQHWLASCPQVPLRTDGLAVGLPEGQMGNSEVGHMNIGAGRVVYQDLTRIDESLKHQSFLEYPGLKTALATHPPVIHLVGLMSDGGVHSHLSHTCQLMDELNQQGHPFQVHAWLDGRDTPPQSAHIFLQTLTTHLGKQGVLGSLIGRYHPMDRDQRWDRIEKAYRLMAQGEGTPVQSFPEALTACYTNGINDEFMPAYTLPGFQPVGEDDLVISLNFRSDRVRQITRAWTDPDFSQFKRPRVLQPAQWVSLTQYDAQFKNPVLFPPQDLKNTLGEVISDHHLTQLRAAETEKYAHVTFFLNGGQEIPFPGESRELIPSPQVATYDLQPEMSAHVLTEALLKAMDSQEHDLIIANFANADMVGHTGKLGAAVSAIETLDTCLGALITRLKQLGGEALITADHGNAECLFDPQSQQPHTAHTQNPVPCLYIGRPAHSKRSTGALQDVAPTLLSLMDLPIPKDMTGTVLFQID